VYVQCAVLLSAVHQCLPLGSHATHCVCVQCTAQLYPQAATAHLTVYKWQFIVLRQNLTARSYKLTDSIERKFSWLAQQPQWTTRLPHAAYTELLLTCHWHHVNLMDWMCLLRQFGVSFGTVWAHRMYVLCAYPKEINLLWAIWNSVSGAAEGRDARSLGEHLATFRSILLPLYSRPNSHRTVLLIKAAKGSIRWRQDCLKYSTHEIG
jgi:hypothetical protein